VAPDAVAGGAHPPCSRNAESASRPSATGGRFFADTHGRVARPARCSWRLAAPPAPADVSARTVTARCVSAGCAKVAGQTQIIGEVAADIVSPARSRPQAALASPLACPGPAAPTRIRLQENTTSREGRGGRSSSSPPPLPGKSQAMCASRGLGFFNKAARALPSPRARPPHRSVIFASPPFPNGGGRCVTIPPYRCIAVPKVRAAAGNGDELVMPGPGRLRFPANSSPYIRTGGAAMPPKWGRPRKTPPGRECDVGRTTTSGHSCCPDRSFVEK